jgi:N-acetylglucosamine-6-sulfatase
MVRLLRSLLLLLGLGLTTGSQLWVSPSTAQSRPNFVTIVVDDLDVASVVQMPAVNELLAREGTTFSRFFATTPLCCPSRVSMLRGQYAHNHGVLRNDGAGAAGFPAFYASGEESVTLATLLHDAGYETALIGKYLNGYVLADDPRVPIPRTYIPPGWDTWITGVDDAPYSHFDYTLNVNGALVDYGHDDDDYLTDVLSDYAVDFVNRVAGTGDPFFLFLTPYAPHTPTVPAPRHEGMFRGATAPRTPAFDEPDVRDKPEWVQSSRRFNERKIAVIDDRYQRRLESLQAVDEMVEALVSKLDAQGVLQSTYILFLSDNGYFLGEHRQPNGKDAPYNAATHIPLIVRGPGISPATFVDEIALNTDLLPTLGQLADLSTPPFVDGRSLVPLWTENAPAWRQSSLFEGFGIDFRPGERPGLNTPPFKALRSEDVLYAEYDTGEREFYDLTADPYELDNIVDQVPDSILGEYSQRLNSLAGCAGASCRSFEDKPLPSFHSE